jgi:hypothetical protein
MEDGCHFIYQFLASITAVVTGVSNLDEVWSADPDQEYIVLGFLNNLWGPGTEQEEGCRTGPPGYMQADGIDWNRLLGSLKVKKFGLCI